MPKFILPFALSLLLATGSVVAQESLPEDVDLDHPRPLLQSKRIVSGQLFHLYQVGAVQQYMRTKKGVDPRFLKAFNSAASETRSLLKAQIPEVDRDWGCHYLKLKDKQAACQTDSLEVRTQRDSVFRKSMLNYHQALLLASISPERATRMLALVADSAVDFLPEEDVLPHKKKVAELTLLAAAYADGVGRLVALEEAVQVFESSSRPEGRRAADAARELLGARTTWLSAMTKAAECRASGEVRMCVLMGIDAGKGLSVDAANARKVFSELNVQSWQEVPTELRAALH